MPGTPSRRGPTSRLTWIKGFLALALVATGCVVAVGPASQASVPAAMAPRSAADGGYGSFSTLSPGLGNVVSALTVADDTLYAGGGFNGGPDDSMITSQSTAGGGWRPLAQGMGGPNGTYVQTLAFRDDTLYAGGSFPNASGVAGTHKIAAWSEGAWHSMKSLDDTQTSGNVAALAALDDTLYATGAFLDIGGVSASHVAAWSDDTWHAMRDGILGPGVAIAAGSTGVYVGDSLAGLFRYRSSDDTWLAMPPGSNLTSVSSLAVHGDMLYVGGTLSPTGGVIAFSNADDTWHGLGPGLNRVVNSLAMDPAHGLLYAGGPFENPSDGDDTYIAQVWDEGISTWIPLDDTAGVTPFESVGKTANASAVDDSVVYLSGNFECSYQVCVAKWTWDAPTAELSTSTGYVGSSVPITGWGLIGVNAVRFGSSPAVYSRDDSTHMTATVPNLSPGTYTVYVDAVGGTATAGTFTVRAPRPPTPVVPSPPLSVAATAGDASAAVSWLAPASSGSSTVTSYQVTSSPGGQTCSTSPPSTSCTVEGLTNGTTYTFTVTATSSAGSSLASAPSNAVTPQAPAPPTATIVIVGTRTNQVARVTGSTTGFGMGGMVTAHTRMRRGVPYADGATTLVDQGGGFDWSRKVAARKTLWVYFTGGGAKSNILVLTP